MFGPKLEEITGGREKLHNWELYDLYYYMYVIKVKHLKSRRMRWKEHVTSMGKKMVEYRALVRKLEEKIDLFGRLVINRDNIKWILKKQDGRAWN
jgi:hypothetical protein